MLASLVKNIYLMTIIGSTISGGLGAVRGDWQAFQSLSDPSQAYGYKVAAWRFVHGAVVGFGGGCAAALSTAGLSSWLGV